MNDTYVKTIDAEPAAVARQLLRMDAYRELTQRLDWDVDSSITVTPALEGAAVAIRIAPRTENGRAMGRWPAVAAEARKHVRRLLRDLAASLRQDSGLAAAA